MLLTAKWKERIEWNKEDIGDLNNKFKNLHSDLLKLHCSLQNLRKEVDHLMSNLESESLDSIDRNSG